MSHPALAEAGARLTVAQEPPVLAATPALLEEALCVSFWALSCCVRELPHLSFFRSCQGTTDLLITDTEIETKQSLLCSVLRGSWRLFQGWKECDLSPHSV